MFQGASADIAVPGQPLWIVALIGDVNETAGIGANLLGGGDDIGVEQHLLHQLRDPHQMAGGQILLDIEAGQHGDAPAEKQQLADGIQVAHRHHGGEILAEINADLLEHCFGDLLIHGADELGQQGLLRRGGEVSGGGHENQRQGAEIVCIESVGNVVELGDDAHVADVGGQPGKGHVHGGFAVFRLRHGEAADVLLKDVVHQADVAGFAGGDPELALGDAGEVHHDLLIELEHLLGIAEKSFSLRRQLDAVGGAQVQLGAELLFQGL